MSNKIDGTNKDSFVDFLKDSISPDDEQATEAAADGESGDSDSDDSWVPDLSEGGAKFKEMLDDGADSLQQGVQSAVGDVESAIESVGTDAKRGLRAIEDGIDAAEQSFDDTVDQLGHAADAAREVFQAKARAQVDELTAMPHETPAPKPIAEQAAESMSRLVDRAGRTLDAHPTDDVVELGEKMLDGELSLGSAIRGLASAHSDTKERVSQEVQSVALDLADGGAQFVDDHSESIEAFAAQNKTFWESPTLATQAVSDPSLMATRAISLKALDTIGDLPELSEKFLAQKDEIGEYIAQGSLDHMTDDIAGLGQGERFERGGSITPSLGLGAGISMPVSANASVEQTAPDTYQVTIEKSGGLGGKVSDLFSSATGKGEGSADLKRTVVLEVSGPNAAEDAALLVSGALDTTSRLALLSQPPAMLAGNVELGAALDADVTGIGADLDMGDMSGIRRDDGDIILEKKLSTTLSGGYQTPVYAQYSEALEDAVNHGDDFELSRDSNPATRAMLEQLPDSFLEELREAHADTAGVSLGFEAEGSATYSYNTAKDAHGVALQTRGHVHAGETSYEVTHDVRINDIAGFERALQDVGAGSFDLMSRAREGTIPQSELMDVIAQHGHALGSTVEYETRIVAETQDMNKVALGDHEAHSGKVQTSTLFQVDDGDVRRRFEGLVASANQGANLADEALGQLRSARRKQ